MPYVTIKGLRRHRGATAELARRTRLTRYDGSASKLVPTRGILYEENDDFYLNYLKGYKIRDGDIIRLPAGDGFRSYRVSLKT